MPGIRIPAWPLAVLVLLAMAVPGAGADEAASDCVGESVEMAVVEPTLGTVTGYRVPRFVSMKSSSGRIRRGPGTRYPVVRKYVVPGIPLRIIGEYESWRKVELWDGTVGWMHSVLLTGARTAFVLSDQTPIRVVHEPDSTVVAFAERGVIAGIEKCRRDWCRVKAGDYKGWVMKACLWGVEAEETL